MKCLTDIHNKNNQKSSWFQIENFQLNSFSHMYWPGFNFSYWVDSYEGWIPRILRNCCSLEDILVCWYRINFLKFSYSFSDILVLTESVWLAFLTFLYSQNQKYMISDFFCHFGTCPQFQQSVNSDLKFNQTTKFLTGKNYEDGLLIS